MKKIRIGIVQFGESKYANEWKFFKDLQNKNVSAVYEIVYIKTISPKPPQYGWEHTYQEIFRELLGEEGDCDYMLAFTDYALEDNYFMRRLSDKIGIVTFYQADYIIAQDNNELKNYILLTIYTSCAIYAQEENLSPEKTNELFHIETRGCPFDMTGVKTDILVSLDKPHLCPSCEARLKKEIPDSTFVEALKRELHRIRKPLLNKIVEWIKKYPLLSLLITIVSTLVLGLATSWLYDFLKTLISN